MVQIHSPRPIESLQRKRPPGNRASSCVRPSVPRRVGKCCQVAIRFPPVAKLAPTLYQPPFGDDVVKRTGAGGFVHPNPIVQRLGLRFDPTPANIDAVARHIARFLAGRRAGGRRRGPATSRERALLARAVRVILVAGAICGVFDAASAIGVLGFFGVGGVRASAGPLDGPA